MTDSEYTESYDPKSRFYEQVYPDVDECVVVKIVNVDEMGAYVKLIEYGNIDALILLSEISRKRLRSANKHVSVGLIDYAKVVRVDKEKGYIDLSKRSVEDSEKKECINKFARSKKINAILKSVSLKTNIPMYDINVSLIWPYLKNKQYSGIKNITDSDNVFFDNNVGLKEILEVTISKHYLIDAKIKFSAIVEITCFVIGIEAIKTAIMAGKMVGLQKDPGIKIQLIKSPQYIIITESNDSDKSIALLKEIINAIKETIESFGGFFNVIVEPNNHSDKLIADNDNDSDSDYSSDEYSAKVIDYDNDNDNDNDNDFYND